MTAAALALVLGSATLHATWNLLTKRAGGGVAFLWLLTCSTVIAYAPAVAVYLSSGTPAIEARHVMAALFSSLLHVGYFLCLQRGYKVGDLPPRSLHDGRLEAAYTDARHALGVDPERAGPVVPPAALHPPHRDGQPRGDGTRCVPSGASAAIRGVAVATSPHWARWRKA